MSADITEGDNQHDNEATETVTSDECPSLHNYCSDPDITLSDFKFFLTTLSSPRQSLLDICSGDGMTALHHLCNQPMPTDDIIGIAGEILTICADSALIHVPSTGKTPLHLAMNWARVRTDDRARAYITPILQLFIRHCPLALEMVDNRGRTPLHALLAGDALATHTMMYIEAAPHTATMRARHLKTRGEPYTPFANALTNCDELVMNAYIQAIRRYCSNPTDALNQIFSDITDDVMKETARNSDWQTLNWLITQGATNIPSWTGFFLPPDTASHRCIIPLGGKTLSGRGGATAATRMVDGKWRWRVKIYLNQPTTPNLDDDGEEGDAEGDDNDDDKESNDAQGVLIGVANTRLVADGQRGCAEGYLGEVWMIDQFAHDSFGSRHGCHRIIKKHHSLTASTSGDDTPKLPNNETKQMNEAKVACGSSDEQLHSGDAVICDLDINKRTFTVSRMNSITKTIQQFGATVHINHSPHYFPYFHVPASSTRIELLDIERLPS